MTNGKIVESAPVRPHVRITGKEKRMKLLSIALIAAVAFAAPAFAGSKSSSESTSLSQSKSRSNSNSSGNTTTFKDRLQPGNVGSFGGGGCPEGVGISGPGAGLTIQWQCKEGKQDTKARTVDSYFGRDGARRWLCQSDKELYTLPACRAYRVENARNR